MDNLLVPRSLGEVGPKDPPNENNNNNPTPASPTGGPPPFGSNFNPHSNPVDPNHPYQSQPPQNPLVPENLVHSAVASHEKRLETVEDVDTSYNPLREDMYYCIARENKLSLAF